MRELSKRVRQERVMRHMALDERADGERATKLAVEAEGILKEELSAYCEGPGRGDVAASWRWWGGRNTGFAGGWSQEAGSYTFGGRRHN